MTNSKMSMPTPYGGYYQTATPLDDQELTRTGPGTPCGEYMRRFWWPVAMVEQVTDLPLLIMVLGEELV
ncbi:MAG TPA: (2Fe-2S)-binding protein, partial [Gammaproteobacteria bacterium]|nr:(2Fe-2S)-binding protein [Gammaproteobacteria bacterium]HBO89240.1 (2Fe-2S)-binding protein [Acidobacteriota bacterium]